jgi:FlaA1/EpsC-like NDP-sugar epimerase
MSISEAVNLVIHAACLTKGDDIFVLRMGEVVRILDIAERMVRLRGLRPYEDIDIQIVGVRPGEKMHEELHDPEENPVETIHPYIMRLSSWKTSGTTGTFFGKLDHLCHNGLNHDAEIVAELTELTTHRQRTI